MVSSQLKNIHCSNNIWFKIIVKWTFRCFVSNKAKICKQNGIFGKYRKNGLGSRIQRLFPCLLFIFVEWAWFHQPQRVIIFRKIQKKNMFQVLYVVYSIVNCRYLLKSIGKCQLMPQRCGTRSIHFGRQTKSKDLRTTCTKNCKHVLRYLHIITTSKPKKMLFWIFFFDSVIIIFFWY